jgi:hypothetical protein
MKEHKFEIIQHVVNSTNLIRRLQRAPARALILLNLCSL